MQINTCNRCKIKSSVFVFLHFNQTQFCHILFVLHEAHVVNKKLNLTFPISLYFCKFCSLHPFFVKKLAEMPHVFFCLYHTNMNLLLPSVQSVCHEFPPNLPAAFVCNDDVSGCMLGECKACGLQMFNTISEGLLSCMEEEVLEKEVTYLQWERAKKVACTSKNLPDILPVMKEKLPHYLRHTLVKH